MSVMLDEDDDVKVKKKKESSKSKDQKVPPRKSARFVSSKLHVSLGQTVMEVKPIEAIFGAFCRLLSAKDDETLLKRPFWALELYDAQLRRSSNPLSLCRAEFTYPIPRRNIRDVMDLVPPEFMTSLMVEIIADAVQNSLVDVSRNALIEEKAESSVDRCTDVVVRELYESWKPWYLQRERSIASASSRVCALLLDDQVREVAREANTLEQKLVTLAQRAHDVILERCFNQLMKEVQVDVEKIFGEYQQIWENAVEKYYERLVDEVLWERYYNSIIQKQAKKAHDEVRAEKLHAPSRRRLAAEMFHKWRFSASLRPGGGNATPSSRMSLHGEFSTPPRKMLRPDSGTPMSERNSVFKRIESEVRLLAFEIFVCFFLLFFSRDGGSYELFIFKRVFFLMF
jgi:hypothetical protein